MLTIQPKNLTLKKVIKYSTLAVDTDSIVTRLLSQDCQIIGVDLGFEDILIAREGFTAYPDLAGQSKSRFRLGVADALHLPSLMTHLQSYLSEVLEHIPDYLATIEEILRVTKPGGRIGVSVPRYWPEKICWLHRQIITMSQAATSAFSVPTS